MKKGETRKGLRDTAYKWNCTKPFLREKRGRISYGSTAAYALIPHRRDLKQAIPRCKTIENKENHRNSVTLQGVDR